MLVPWDMGLVLVAVVVVVGIDERHWGLKSPVTLRLGSRSEANNLSLVFAVVGKCADVPEHVVAVVAQHWGDRSGDYRQGSHKLMFLTLEGAHMLTVDGDARIAKSQGAAAAAGMACSRLVSDCADQAIEQARDVGVSGLLRTNWIRWAEGAGCLLFLKSVPITPRFP